MNHQAARTIQLTILSRPFRGSKGFCWLMVNGETTFAHLRSLERSFEDANCVVRIKDISGQAA